MNDRNDPPGPIQPTRKGAPAVGRPGLLGRKRNVLWLAVLIAALLALFMLLGRTPDARTNGPRQGSVEQLE